MDYRKDDTARTVNLLELYKSKLNQQDDRSLKKAMDKLISTLKSPLFSALLDIQEFYEISLSTALEGSQPKHLKEPVVTNQDYSPEEPIEQPVKLKKERSKKSKRHQKSQEDEHEPLEAPNEQEQVSPKYAQGSLSPKHSAQDYPDSKHMYKEEEAYEDQEENEEDSQNPWLYYEIDLAKGRKGYGFAVAGGYDKPHYEGDNGIFVTKIIPEGAAEVDGRLRIDDVILRVNEVELDHVTHNMAVETLKNAGQRMILVIRRLNDNYIMANETEHGEMQQNLDYYSQEPDAYQEESGEVANFQQFEVTLTKRTGGLGISIQGGYNPSNHEEDSYISISRLTPNGVADVDGRLQVGDIILHVDNTSLNGVTHEEAVNLLKNTGKTVTLYIGRYVEAEQEVEPEQHHVPVVEKTERKKKKKHRHDREE